MQLNQLFGTEDDRAVSPVIGVVLMLTATVIIGGVVASFVTGMGTGMESAPQASFSFDHDSDTLNITHEGGEAIDADQLSVKVNDSEPKSISGEHGYEDPSVSLGDKISVDDANSNSTVRLIWTDSNGDKETQLAKWVGTGA